jgi:crotonobetaine/carnitine-CoA ligase
MTSNPLPFDSSRFRQTSLTLPALLALRAEIDAEAAADVNIAADAKIHAATHAGTHVEIPLFSDRRTTWTAQQAIEAAARRAGALAAEGVKRGDRVALLCSNRIEFMEVVLGCAWLGAIVVPINTASRGLPLQHILSNSAARLLVIESTLLGLLDMLDFEPLAIESIWVIGARDGNPEQAPRVAMTDPVVLPRPSKPWPAPGEALAAAELGPGDPLAILYTSGTSGPSKGVICPHAQFYWWGVHTARLLGVVQGDVLYTVLPLFHTNALNTFFQALVSGASVVVDARFSASGFFDALAETGATVTYLLGAMVPILLSRPTHDGERAHRVRIALGPGVPAACHAEFLTRCGIGLIEGFGSTETNFVIAKPLGSARPEHMGRIVPGFQACVVDENDAVLPDGVAGELLLRADEPFSFASGYFGMPEKTVEAWRNLWFHTGDRVVRESDGYYRFIDRIKDAIRRRGENISSHEVEQALMSHASIETVAVYAVRSELAEDEVMAMIVPRAGATLTPVEVIEWCEPRLAYFAVPRFVEFTDELPKTSNGKIQKFALRERGIGTATWDREAAGYKLKRLDR